MLSPDELTPELARALLSYDPATGLFSWSADRSNGRKVGRPVGTIAANGYVMIKLRGKARLAHRLAWLIMFERWPTYCIDHINGSRADNRLANLRDVPHKANMRNATHVRTRLLVGAIPSANGWKSAVHRYGKADELGTFKTADEANAVWLEASKLVRHPDRPKPKVRLLLNRLR